MHYDLEPYQKFDITFNKHEKLNIRLRNDIENMILKLLKYELKIFVNNFIRKLLNYG